MLPSELLVLHHIHCAKLDFVALFDQFCRNLVEQWREGFGVLAPGDVEGHDPDGHS